MLQDDARLLRTDRTAEDVVVAALVALIVGPLRQLLGTRRVTETARALPHHEAEHDAQRLGAVVHCGRYSHGVLAAVKRRGHSRRPAALDSRVAAVNEDE